MVRNEQDWKGGRSKRRSWKKREGVSTECGQSRLWITSDMRYDKEVDRFRLICSLMSNWQSGQRYKSLSAQYIDRSGL